MVIEKQPQGNHSSVVCEREYELGTSSSEFNSTKRVKKPSKIEVNGFISSSVNSSIA